MRFGFVIHMMKLQILLLGAGPTLIGDFAVGRVDHDALAGEKREGARMLLHAIHGAPGACVIQ